MTNGFVESDCYLPLARYSKSDFDGKTSQLCMSSLSPRVNDIDGDHPGPAGCSRGHQIIAAPSCNIMKPLNMIKECFTKPEYYYSSRAVSLKPLNMIPHTLEYPIDGSKRRVATGVPSGQLFRRLKFTLQLFHRFTLHLPGCDQIVSCEF